ncbi:PREDICTED: E3 ubiquitin-protein ligase RGLG2-like isoform X2 [Tarenaya hassleriana]|uniref:E3 ubiquitin-protein ligase RGLG2-like isoform X2 n=1 Tax=Tarenaya hassleriana TaxID=28532 RepID=UPI00053C722A|nr:PREDICTED: E3 ubiquitin-protein ligase RGLG2-like isoform X2 [Tarenaya hassleriana]
MGSGNSKRTQRQDSFSSRSDSSASSDQESYILYGQESYSYPPQQICSSDYAYPQPRCYSQAPPEPPSNIHGSSWKKPGRSYADLADEYTSTEQVVEALARAGLESCDLIVGIDFTKSNEWTGAKSYGRKCLHYIGDQPNPYEQVIATIGKTLGVFSEDNLIPCYGFGDASTHGQDVFSFYPDERSCYGFEDLLCRYREIVPHLRFAGPTSFAPIIEMAMAIVEQSGGQYHALVIVADGQEQSTARKLVFKKRRLRTPLSKQVGVGDGPWDKMREFCSIPNRVFSNFDFVNFTEIMSKDVEQNRKEAEFVLSALMDIPLQYKATLELGILGRRYGDIPKRTALPPPVPLSSPQPETSSTFDDQANL